MSLKFGDCLESRELRSFFVNLPNIAFALRSCQPTGKARGSGFGMTLLLPATRQEPSEARLIERIGMSPAGVWMPNEVGYSNVVGANVPVRGCICSLTGPTA